MYDNYFEPPKLEIPIGATVRWVNYGQHTHTVTSTTKDWGSSNLSAKQEYSYTFQKAGTYHYFCEHHPETMRGTIVVK
jgi:plastocyanin